MTTQNAYLDSDAVRIKISGTTNLRAQSYDQFMTIIPKVSDTLPVIGGLAAGSQVGWGLLLLQKLFNKPIEKSVEIEYKVGGPWDNPTLVLLSEPEDFTEPSLESPTSR